MLLTNNTMNVGRSGGRLHTEVRNLCITEQNNFSKKYLTYGTSAGNFLHDINGSVTPEADKLAGIYDSGWVNDLFITAQQYCASTLNQWQKKFDYDQRYAADIQAGIKTAKKPVGVDWLELYTPAIVLYRRELIEKILRNGLGRYHRRAKDCFCADIFEDPNEYIGEYWIKLASYLPAPSYIILGKPCGARPKKERDSFLNKILPAFERTFSGSTILHLPEATITCGKKNNARTGTDVISTIELKIIQFINNLEKQSARSRLAA